MLKNKRLLLVTLFLVLAAMVVLCMKVDYPRHRLWSFTLLMLGWIPITLSYRINRDLLRRGKLVLKTKARPFRPHIVVAVLLVIAFYVTWVLFPVYDSPLAKMTPAQIRTEVDADLGNYLMLRKTADDIAGTFSANGLLARDVASLSKDERKKIRSIWRDGVMTFLEFDLLKEKYRGFYQIDYNAEPALHADAFFLAYGSYIAQYNACLAVYHMVGENEFMETLLNEPGEGIPLQSFHAMKKRLTHPRVILRSNAGTAYYELVKADITIEASTVADFEKRRKAFFATLTHKPELFIENPLDILERAAFEAWFPLQQKVATQMSYIRIATRDYLITPNVIEQYRDQLEPGDILLQRRNWCMTNIGIPGFWPHAALYVGTLAEIETAFGSAEEIKTRYPEIYQKLKSTDDGGHAYCVLEAISPGVVLQSLEKSAYCDYLAVVRPNVSKSEKQQTLMAAFSHYGKPYDLNFDFTTDNELVCSELVYKAYKPLGKLPFYPEIVSGRLLLPPNRMAEQIVQAMEAPEPPFLFVLFLDAVEKTDQIKEGTLADFKASHARPKWDVLQE